MATFVLVHGSWMGGWLWHDVAAQLRDDGHEAFRPTLTGVGDRAHLASPDIGLDTHIQDIVGLIEYEQLRDVILVGYSYGGMVITGVAERIPERLAHLVYLDAYIPRDGQSSADIAGPEATAWVTERAERMGDGWRVPHDPPDAPGRTDQPLKPLLDPLPVRNPQAAKLPRTFILCTQGKVPEDPIMYPLLLTAHAVTDPQWQYFEVESGHVFWEHVSSNVANILNQLGRS